MGKAEIKADDDQVKALKAEGEAQLKQYALDKKFAIEIKIKRDKHTLEDGKDQLADYLDILGLKEGYLVIFEPADKEWEEKIYYKSIQHRDKKITLVGM